MPAGVLYIYVQWLCYITIYHNITNTVCNEVHEFP